MLTTEIVMSRHDLEGPLCVCRGVDVPTFASKMYQWASTLTYQGRNMPFALPFRTDPLETGFVVRRSPNNCCARFMRNVT